MILKNPKAYQAKISQRIFQGKCALEDTLLTFFQTQIDTLSKESYHATQLKDNTFGTHEGE